MSGADEDVFRPYLDRSLPPGAQRTHMFHAKPCSMSAGDAQLLAIGAGVRIRYLKTRVRTAANPDGRLIRYIGAFTWNPSLHRLTAWAAVDVTAVDAAAIFRSAAERALAGVPGPQPGEKGLWKRFVNAHGPGISALVGRWADGNEDSAQDSAVADLLIELAVDELLASVLAEPHAAGR